jgi:AraC family transcriptional regulator
MLKSTEALEASTCHVELVQGDWPHPTNFTWAGDELITTLLFRSHDFQAKGRYGGHSGDPFQLIGDIFLAIPGMELVTWGSGGRINAVRCIFKAGTYEDLSPRWDRLGMDQVSRALHIRNPAAKLLLREMRQELLAPGFASEALLDSLAASLMIHCMRETQGARPAEIGHGLLPYHLKRIDDYLESCTAGTPTIAAIARECGFNPDYFCRLFKNTTGQSVGRYLSGWQMRRAETLLIKSDLPIKEIAHRTGFSTAANFSTAFRRERQRTPAMFRRYFRNTQLGGSSRVS